MLLGSVCLSAYSLLRLLLFLRGDPVRVQVSHDAEKSEISRAYRKLSVQFHPDKNPDPAAHKYFAEFITKAYKALTGVATDTPSCHLMEYPLLIAQFQAFLHEVLLIRLD